MTQKLVYGDVFSMYTGYRISVSIPKFLMRRRTAGAFLFVNTRQRAEKYIM